MAYRTAGAGGYGEAATCGRQGEPQPLLRLLKPVFHVHKTFFHGMFRAQALSIPG